jgi:hypothetical protein
MRRPTGPGKVKDNLNLPPARRQGVTGLLYNFDIDDASLKKEHQDWLLKNAAPVAASQGAQVFLKGSASRSGANDYNLQLSDRRVHAVRDFLARQHVRPEQFHLTWVGEEEAALTERDGTENESDRAVSIAVRLPARRGVTKFRRRLPLDIEDGFDAERMPQWLMVPALGQRRELILVHGQGMQLFTDHPSIAQLVSPVTGKTVNELNVTRDREVVTFQGNASGEATIFARNLATGAVEPLLEISSLFPKIIRIPCWLVTDPDHTTPGRTTASIDQMFAVAKKVWLRQANIILGPTPPQTLNFTTRLSDPAAPLVNGVRPITPRTAGGDKFPVLSRRGDTTARINTFYVWEWEADDTRNPESADAQADDIPGRNIVYEDRTAPTNDRDEGLSLAHEIGHCLGLEHTGTEDTALRPRLMWNFTNDRGGVLSREEVLIAQRNV